MGPSSDESSSDLMRAREISRRLVERNGRPGPQPAAPPAPVLRFSADQVRAAAGLPANVATPPPAASAAAVPPPGQPGPAPQRATAPLPPLPPLPANGTWEALVGWCRAALGGESAFLMDEHGLLVALAGKLGHDEAEGIGGRLVYLFEQADEMKGGERTTRSVSLGFGVSHLSGFRIAIAGGVLLTLGIFTAKPAHPEAGAIVARAFSSKKSAA